MNLQLSERYPFGDVDWRAIPDLPGAYVVYEGADVLYVGMAGRGGKGCLRNRLRDHASGQIVNMFAQYLFLARVQFEYEDEHGERITHPREAKRACQRYVRERCSFEYLVTADAAEARALELRLKQELDPVLNP